MLQLLRRRLQGEREGGFTLIELMVVVLIIAILIAIAIAIPTFLGARTRAPEPGRPGQPPQRPGGGQEHLHRPPELCHRRGCRADRGRAGPDRQGQGHGLHRPERRLGGRDHQRRAVGGGGAVGQRDLLLDKDNIASGTTYGTGATCTGTAALGAAGTSW